MSNEQMIEQFRALYTSILIRNLEANPGRYAPKVRDDIPGAVDKMMKAIEDNRILHTGIALTTTCFTLGIKSTSKAIREHLGYEYKQQYGNAKKDLTS
jgi:hypothetical protein